jgi:8-oxo-dGTP pyrophosphatase MutT (NUDIX family)
MKLGERVGLIGFYLAWPALYIYLKQSTRTRIVVLYQGQVLVLKNWLSDNRWSIPGGGLHKDEDPKLGAIRELFEETGIQAAAVDLEAIGEGRYRLHGLSYAFRSYMLRLDSEPVLRRQHIEVSRITWLRPSELHLDHTSPDVLTSLTLLRDRHPEILIQ